MIFFFGIYLLGCLSIGRIFGIDFLEYLFGSSFLGYLFRDWDDFSYFYQNLLPEFMKSFIVFIIYPILYIITRYIDREKLHIRIDRMLKLLL